MLLLSNWKSAASGSLNAKAEVQRDVTERLASNARIFSGVLAGFFRFGIFNCYLLDIFVT